MIHGYWDRSFSEGWKVCVKKDKYMTQPPEPGDVVLVSRKNGETKLVKLKNMLYHRLPKGARDVERWEFKPAGYEDGGEDGLTQEWETWAQQFAAAQEASRRGEEVGGGEGRTVC